MLNYFPLDAGVSFDCVSSDLLGFDWQNRTADFIIPDDDEHLLRVRFPNGVIVRMLDEMALSTEDDPSTCRGLSPNHFAYRVEGASFPEALSEAWKAGLGSVEHYQFITGWGCLDVVTTGAPEFEIIPLDR